MVFVVTVVVIEPKDTSNVGISVTVAGPMNELLRGQREDSLGVPVLTG